MTDNTALEAAFDASGKLDRDTFAAGWRAAMAAQAGSRLSQPAGDSQRVVGARWRARAGRWIELTSLWINGLGEVRYLTSPCLTLRSHTVATPTVCHLSVPFRTGHNPTKHYGTGGNP